MNPYRITGPAQIGLSGGRRFTLSEQVHMCGNSVSPGTMKAYARVNDPWRRRRELGIAA